MRKGKQVFNAVPIQNPNPVYRMFCHTLIDFKQHCSTLTVEAMRTEHNQIAELALFHQKKLPKSILCFDGTLYFLDVISKMLLFV